MEAAVTLVRGGPSAADLRTAAAFGFRPEDYPGPVVALWPDTEAPIRLFCELGTQWRAGPGGAYGLDYPVAWGLMARRGIEGEDWETMFADLRVMEHAALAALETTRG